MNLRSKQDAELQLQFIYNEYNVQLVSFTTENRGLRQCLNYDDTHKYGQTFPFPEALPVEFL